MQEIWKPIENFEKTYEVSNMGQVRSIPRYKTKGKILKLQTNKNGYIYCCLCQNNKKYLKRVHILVAKAFLKNPNNLSEINHKDEVKSNNVYTNLEWCTRLYNTHYGTKILRQSKKVIGLKDNVVVVEFVSTAEAGRNGFNGHHIVSCCNGKRKTHKGLVWKYKENKSDES